MNPFFALLARRTEAGQVELAQRLPHVLLAASRSERAEPFFIVRARREFGFRVDVQVQAVFAIGTV